MAATSSIPTFLMAQSQARMRCYSPFLHVRRSPTTTCSAYRKNGESRHFGNHHIVDESMITLRKRMHEAKLAEMNYEPPADWMDWEKRYHMQYSTDVFELIGILQGLLINTRPSLALGIMGLFMISVPTSAILGVRFLIDLLSFVYSHVNFLS